MVIANSDYIVDSLCRQLRSLELNPDVPNVLAAMLSYIGVAHSILPLLEEPVCLNNDILEIGINRIILAQLVLFCCLETQLVLK